MNIEKYICVLVSYIFVLENSREIGILIFEVFTISKYFRNVSEKNKLLYCKIVFHVST